MKKSFSVLICMLLIIPHIIVMLSTPINAAVDTIYEVEKNDTAALADYTYDDHDSYGKISSSTDVDWWCVSFDTSGMVNFYLGNIPSDCDFDMFVYKNDGTTLIAQSKYNFDHYELVRCHVNAGNVYRIKIVCDYAPYFPDQYYLFRVKNYGLNGSNPAKVFSFNYYVVNKNNQITDIVDSTPTEDTLSNIWNMGFGGQAYYNNSVSPAYNELPNTNVFLVTNHAKPGRMRFFDSTLVAEAYSGMPSNYKALSSYSSGALSRVDLLIFLGCETGITNVTYGNLVDVALEKGTYCCIGWASSIDRDDAHQWINLFFDYCDQGTTVYTALKNANQYMIEYGANDIYTITNQYYGDSPLTKLVIDKY